ncbi:hypothetical protein VN97_g475 [Penicillium thymicola]|uniref:Uncharacterized protein n=1 Tax=Penicillium thymicola TaxID=293382 RepID=A0AAI9TST3_PENTH|nr:hypothetical protein VN97_g475 [Penicillium thymicola]
MDLPLGHHHVLISWPFTMTTLNYEHSFLTVAGFGFRTIGRLVRTPSIIRLGHPSPHHFDYFNHNQSDRGGLWLQDNRQTGYNRFDYPPRSTLHLNHNQSDRGGLRLQDNRQTGCHYPPRSTATSIIHPPP